MDYQNYETITVDIESGVCIVTLNKPKVRNALVEEMREELRNFFQVAEQDKNVKSIILTGKDHMFSSGGDLKSLQTLTAIQIKDRLKKSQDLIVSILKIQKPVIAAVEGVAAGAGFSLALACDLMYASKSAVFIQSFIKIGVVPDLGSLYFLPTLVGRKCALEMMLLGEKVCSTKMKELGVVNRVCDDGDVLKEAIAAAKKLGENPKMAMGLIKQITNDIVLNDIKRVFQLESIAQGVCIESPDFKEGVQAFFEKREPVYQ